MRIGTDRLMVVGGLMVISARTLLIAQTPLQFAGSLVCILLIVAGLSGLGRHLQPDSRIYVQLRAEVEQFLTLVRKINVHAVAAEGKQASVTKTAMHESVDRIALVAGVVGEKWERKKETLPLRIRESRRPQPAPTPAAAAGWVTPPDRDRGPGPAFPLSQRSELDGSRGSNAAARRDRAARRRHLLSVLRPH